MIKKLLSGKVPDLDEILKFLNIVAQSWLVCLFSVTRRAGTMPVGWQTDVLVLIFKKRGRRVCSNYRRTTRLNL